MYQRVRLVQFRSYTEREVALSPSVTIISGPNGSGKTNLLEALYVVSVGSSFRGNDEALLQINAPWWRLETVGHDDEKRTAYFDVAKTSARKQFTLDGVRRQRLSYAQKKPVVLFEPGDLRLIHGSPARRRLFLDTLIAQSEPLYGPLLGKYERALRQRNNLLKTTRATPDELFVWDVAVSDYGARIISQRQAYVELLHKRIGHFYQSIAQREDNVMLEYPFYQHESAIQQALMVDLHKNHARDIALGYTTVGPHRHDILFDINSSPAVTVASRGETRSLVLALKLIEVEMLREKRRIAPLLLLDDVFSELDKERRAALTNLGAHTQTVITTTDADVVRMPKRVEYVSVRL